ncbi:MAG: PIG-L family deacetylase [Bacteroidota bacterium]
MKKLLFILGFVLVFSSVSFSQHVPSIMNLSAHPDDEDGATLAYYRYKYGVKVYSVCFTRGEGGQNEIGPELYADLGVLRTAETERAARIIGSEVYFLNFVDFGFSKTAKETFDFWGKDNTIARLVYIIRKLKPDVLFTNHDSVSGHGNHQAVGIAALQAFSLAADSTYHPEQLKEPGVGLFQPKKLFMRIFFQRDSLLKPDVVNAVAADTLALGKTAVQLATEALAQHRTQGMDKIIASGRFGRFFDSTRYVLVRSSGKFANARNDFLGGLHTPDETRLPLIPSRQFLSVSLSDSIVVRNQKFTLQIKPLVPVSQIDATLHLPAGWTSRKLEGQDKNLHEIVVASDARFTYPKVRHLYETMQTLPLITVEASYERQGKRETEEIRVFVDVAPLQTLSLTSQVFHVTDEPLKIPFNVKNYFPNKAAGRVTAIVPSGWDALSSEFIIGREDSVYNDSITIIPAPALREGIYPVRVCIDGDTASAMLKKFDVGVAPRLNIGIVQSYDDSKTLSDLNVPHRLLNEDDLSSGDLRSFTAIIIDIRAYLVRKDLVKNNVRLLEYVKNGGTLIVMYQRIEEWKPEYAPYPFAISRNRITVETAPVTVLDPGNILFNAPNKIDSTAWDDWVQERSLYMPSSVPGQYDRLLSSSDPGESPLDTGLLVAKYGAGKYLYTAYVWYRELKEVNKGATLMFANMISLGKTK